jgi:phage baseplate assembly protein W
MALTYRGFNTIDQNKKFRLTDLNLVKRDLINHFQIRKGEKLMNPSFGSLIWNTLFEPLDERTKKIILDDVKSVVSYDPRLAVDEVIVQQLDSGLQIQMTITYLPTNMTEVMSLTFDRDTGTVA